MKKTTIYEQIPLVERTTEFITKYGVKIQWLAEKTQVPSRCLSEFINQKSMLYKPQVTRLVKFMDEYDKRMIGFI